MLIEEIHKRGIDCVNIPQTVIVEARHGDEIHFLTQYTLPIIPRIYAMLLDNKTNFKALLRHYHIPYILDSRTFSSASLNAGLAYARDMLGFPVVCKPQYGKTMERVFIGICNEEEFINIWHENYSSYKDEFVIVEKWLQHTNDYRFFCFREHPSAVLCRRAPCITGDGCSSIAELVVKENNVRTDTTVFLTPLQLNGVDTKRILSHQGVTLDTIPPKGKSILLAYGADVNRGGLCEVIELESIHAEYWPLVHKVWDLFPGMPYFSLDILATDITLPPDPQHTAINESHIEADATPLLYPAQGKSVNIFSHFVDLLFPTTRGS